MLKKLAILAAAATLMLSAGSAYATFADLELIRVYYDRTGDEYITDLGPVKTLIAADSTTISGSFGSLSKGFVAYFAVDRLPSPGLNQFWASGATYVPYRAPDLKAYPLIVGGTKGVGSVPPYNIWNEQDGIDYTGPATDPNGYKLRMSSSPGNMNGVINNFAAPYTEASLDALINTGSGSVTQLLYFWADANAPIAVTPAGLAGRTGKAVATIITNSDGSTTISKNVVDFVPPVVHVTSPPLNGATYYVMSFDSPTTNIGFTATEAAGEITAYMIDGSTGSGPAPSASDARWIPIIPATNSFTWSQDYTVSNVNPGWQVRQIYFWTKDNAGNVSDSAGINGPNYVTFELRGSTAASPTITWATPAAITYGTPLSAAQLNATANDAVTAASVPGSFSFSPAGGSVLNAGTQPLTVTFTPTDTVNYIAATATVNLAVNQAIPAITWATPAAITYGTAISTTQLNASANVAGEFAYSPLAGTVLGNGSQNLTATFTPNDATNYGTANTSVSLTVSPTVKIVGNVNGYDTLLGLLPAITQDSIIQLRDVYTTVLPETLLFDNGFIVTLNGGMDAAWAPTSGSTVIKGKVTIKSGKLIANRVAIGTYVSGSMR